MTASSMVVRLATRQSALSARAFWVASFATALVAFAVQSVAWPLFGGRDGSTYLMYYLDMWTSDPAFPQLMLFRTPVAPLFFGPPLQLGGPLLAEAALGLAYAASVASYVSVALAFGRVAALATGLALVLYPSYGALFHQVSSDSVFAFGFALWMLFVVRSLATPTARVFALHGAAVWVLVLTRPASLFLSIFALVPFLLGVDLRQRLKCFGAFVATLALLLVAWSSYNDVRYGDFTVSRTSGAHYPLYRVFVADRLVAAENGPASRELAIEVERRLLPYDPYRSYGIDLDEFFGSGSDRMWGDLVTLSDRVWGWDSDYSKLRTVAIEAIRRHPKLYAYGVYATINATLSYPYQVRHQVRPRPSSEPEPRKRDYVVVNGRRLPKAEDGQAIPGGRAWWLASTPDGRVDSEAGSKLNGRVLELLNVPARDGSESVAAALNAIARAYPPMYAWIAIGLVALVVARPRRWVALLLLAALPASVIFGTALGEPPVLEYRVPFDPALMTFGVVATTAAVLRLLAARPPRDGPERQAERQTQRVERA